MSTISQYNKQVATDIEYIRYAIATTLEPIIEKLIQLVYKLLMYINYISQAWFGINLFANASAKGFEKINKSASKLKKTLTGFDEMNILQDDGSIATGGGGGGIPSFDLSAPENIEVPKWLQWIVEHGNLVKTVLEGIGAGLTAIKLGMSGLQGVGIFLVLDGFLRLLQNIKKYLDDPSWKNMGDILKAIGEIAAGIALIVGIATPIGQVIAVLAQAFSMIGGIISLIESLTKWFKDPSWENWKNVWRDSISSMGLVGDLILWIFDLFGGFENVIEPLRGVYEWFMKTVWPSVTKVFQSIWNTIVTVFSPVVSFFSSIFGTVWENIKTVWHNVIEIFTFVWTKISDTFGGVGNFFKSIFLGAYNKIKEVFSPITNFFSNIWTQIKSKLSDFGAKVGEVVGGAFKKVINAVLSTIENVLNTPINGINKLIGVAQTFGINLKKLSTFNLPRLAVGGIVNMPGKGINYGGANIGERGPEGVIPLTNEQSLRMIADAIANQMSLNATIPIYVGNRQIAREIRQIDLQSKFAANR